MVEDWTDEELVAEVLKGKGNETSLHLDTLFWRHFDSFEKTIRAVLHSYGIPFSDQESYYNDVFDEIYERVFEPRNFRRLASKFDPSRSSSFFRWFFGTVLQSRIIDWLRSKSRVRGEKNRTYLTLKYPTRVASQMPEGGADTGVSKDAGSPDTITKEKAQRSLQRCIEKLSSEDRALTKLLFLGTTSLHQEDLDFLAGRKQCGLRELLDELASYETEFQSRYERDAEKAERIDVDLGINHFLLLRNQRMLRAKIRDRHAVQGTEADLDHIRERFTGLGLTDVRTRRKGLEKAFREGSVSASEYGRDRFDLEACELLIYETKLNRKTAGLIEEWDRLFSPVNKAVGNLMNLSPKRVSEKKRNAVAKLKKCLKSFA